MSARERDSRLSTADLAGASPAGEAVANDRMEDEGGRPRENGRYPDDGARENHERAPLFPTVELDQMRGDWNGIQGRFVDDPRASVEAADHLVASAVQRLAQSFAQERSRLEGQWAEGDVSTEDLRQALRRYRSFFDRLLSV